MQIARAFAVRGSFSRCRKTLSALITQDQIRTGGREDFCAATACARQSISLSLFLSLYRRSRVYDRSWDVNPRPRAWLTRLTCSLSLQNWTHRYDKRGLLSMYSENRAELTLAACRKVNIRDLKSVLRHDAQHSWPDDARTASKCSTFHVADKPECFPAATVRTGGGRMHPSHFDREGQPFRKNLSPAERVNFSSSQKKKKRMIIDATLAPSVH